MDFFSCAHTQNEMLPAIDWFNWTFNSLVGIQISSFITIIIYSTTDELEIDSPEIREIFLAKIYELSNPSSAMEELEDDFKCECTTNSCQQSTVYCAPNKKLFSTCTCMQCYSINSSLGPRPIFLYERI